MAPRVNITNQKFGRLLAHHPDPTDGRKWQCTCDCGKTLVVLNYHLRSGNTKSCGCLQRELVAARSTKHGNAKRSGFSPTYTSWAAMWTRATNDQRKEWEHYGGRGIAVHEPWKDFALFLADMGERPEGLTLERRKVDQGYTPENCYWAGKETQANNQRRIRKYMIDGKLMSRAQAARHWGVHVRVAAARLLNIPQHKETA